MDDPLSSLLKEAFASYLSKRTEHDLDPKLPFLPYDFQQWKLPGIGGDMVAGQLNELTNNMHRWKNNLRRWHAWNLTLARYSDIHQAWDIRLEFVEALVHQCLLEPSALRDQITYIATQSLHQVRLAFEDSYPDQLEGDPTTKKPRPPHLTRSRKEARLAALIARWPIGELFIAALQLLDGDDYVNATMDYRNRSSHAIPPHIELGHVETVTRRIVPSKKPVPNERGTIDFVDTADLVVQYGIGGMPPLELEAARKENLKQYLLARDCYRLYREVLAAAGMGQ